VLDDTDRKGFELAKRLLELCEKVLGILPLGAFLESHDWKVVRQKIVTKEDATELLGLAQEIQKLREELDKL
jgi:HEPN domain-containing protein